MELPQENSRRSNNSINFREKVIREANLEANNGQLLGPLPARLVAIADLIFTIFEMVLLVHVAAVVVVIYNNNNNNNNGVLLNNNRRQEEEEESDGGDNGNNSIEFVSIKGFDNPWLMWTLLILKGMRDIVQIWAIMQLMKGTEVGRDMNEALELTGTYQNFTVAFLVIALTAEFFYGKFIAVMVTLGLRGTFMFVVNSFREEIREKSLMEFLVRYNDNMVVVV